MGQGGAGRRSGDGHVARRVSGLVLVMLAAALWATVGVASELFPKGRALPDEVYGFVRTAIAGPALLLCALVAGGAGQIRPRAGSVRGFLVFGLCCALFQIGLFRSFTYLGVTVTVFLTVCLPPVIAVGWSLLRRTERPSRDLLAAMGLAVVGLAAFVLPVDTGGAGGGMASGVGPGLAFSVMASVAFVAMSHAGRALCAEHRPLLVAGLGLSLTAVVLAPVAVVMWPAAWGWAGVARVDWRDAGMLVYLGLVPTALAYLCYCSGMARCRSALAGLVASMIEPAVAAGLAFLFLREVLGLWEVAGCVLLFFAMLVLWLYDVPASQRRTVA